MDRTKAEERVLRFLLRGAARLEEAADHGMVVLDGNDRGTISAARRLVDAMVEARLVSLGSETIVLTREGVACATRLRNDALSARRQEPEAALDPADAGAAVIMNAAESPLALLWRRKTKDGSRFLDDREFAAGERLRRDYTRGQIMPRLGVNWSAAGASGRRDGHGGGMADMTDAALVARRKVDLALAAVGPELSGLLVDVCCFLKGLEQVEAERGWPARSAKVVLKTALCSLARHYEPRERARDAQRPLLHWGAPDYRPQLA